MADTPLTDVSGWSKNHIARLKESWITTAEQVVALSATADGVRSLAQQLNIPEDEVRRLVDAARAKLSPETLKEMEQTVNTGEYGLGVLPPEEDDDGKWKR
jgi:hypothetical protein